MLAKPGFTPPGWVFGAVWPVLYLLIGLAFSVVLNARGARGRGLAITLFVVQLLCNLAWSPLFFAAHEVTLAAYLAIMILVLAAITTVLFWRVRSSAGLLMLPYLAWLVFAAVLSFQIQQLNPGAETLVPPRRSYPDIDGPDAGRTRNKTMQSENRFFDDLSRLINGAPARSPAWAARSRVRPASAPRRGSANSIS